MRKNSFQRSVNFFSGVKNANGKIFTHANSPLFTFTSNRTYSNSTTLGNRPYFIQHAIHKPTPTKTILLELVRQAYDKKLSISVQHDYFHNVKNAISSLSTEDPDALLKIIDAFTYPQYIGILTSDCCTKEIFDNLFSSANDKKTLFHTLVKVFPQEKEMIHNYLYNHQKTLCLQLHHEQIQQNMPQVQDTIEETIRIVFR
ncbi:MAG: hypothetical protein ACK4PR_00490 [Gammaproteobacteria bacterium]